MYWAARAKQQHWIGIEWYRGPVIVLRSLPWFGIKSRYHGRFVIFLFTLHYSMREIWLYVAIINKNFQLVNSYVAM